MARVTVGKRTETGAEPPRLRGFNTPGPGGFVTPVSYVHPYLFVAAQVNLNGLGGVDAKGAEGHPSWVARAVGNG